jgi:hypothetical protein
MLVSKVALAHLVGHVTLLCFGADDCCKIQGSSGQGASIVPCTRQLHADCSVVCVLLAAVVSLVTNRSWDSLPMQPQPMLQMPCSTP